MKMVYLVSPFWEAHPKAVFESREDATKYIKEFSLPNHQVIEYVLWEKGQDIKEIINPTQGITHSDYAKKYYGFYYYDEKSKKGMWSGNSPNKTI